MNTLNLEMFIGAQRDFEATQFHILNGLQRIRKDFSQNKIYPPLSELIELYTTLKTITHRSNDIRQELPRRMTGIDLKAKRIVYEAFDLSNDDLITIENLIRWALPHIHQAIEEGQTIYNFVDDNLKVEEVGILPTYIEEGYLLLPEVKRDLLHVIRYEISIFSGPDQQYRNLKTHTIETMPLSRLDFTPGRVKLDLMASHRELPNPATYFFSTELDFPFNETMLPVAKRKLLRQIYS